MKDKISLPYQVYMQTKIDKEGFHYAFHDYSDFEEVEDEKFHELRKAYLKATTALCEYMGVYPSG